MQDFSCPALLRCRLSDGSCLRLRGFHLLRPAFPGRSADIDHKNRRRSYNPVPAVTGTVWAPARSLATTCAITVVFFSSGYLDVSVPRVRLTPCVIPCRARWVAPFGNPWLIAGICPWPRLIAACHVLLRLREPRHPSCALFSFPFRLDFFACLRSVAFCGGWVVNAFASALNFTLSVSLMRLTLVRMS